MCSHCAVPAESLRAGPRVQRHQGGPRLDRGLGAGEVGEDWMRPSPRRSFTDTGMSVSAFMAATIDPMSAGLRRSSGAAVGLQDLRHRAPAVQVDDGGAQRGDPAHRRGGHGGLEPKIWKPVSVSFGVLFQEAQGRAVVRDSASADDHLREAQARAVAARRRRGTPRPCTRPSGQARRSRAR